MTGSFHSWKSLCHHYQVRGFFLSAYLFIYLFYSSFLAKCCHGLWCWIKLELLMLIWSWAMFTQKSRMSVPRVEQGCLRTCGLAGVHTFCWCNPSGPCWKHSTLKPQVSRFKLVRGQETYFNAYFSLVSFIPLFLFLSIPLSLYPPYPHSSSIHPSIQ